MKQPYSICLLNIGNSNIQMMKIINGNASPVELFPTNEFHERLLPSGMPCAAASVVPALRERLKEWGVFLVGKENKLPFTTDKLDMSTVGADRIANAAALTSGPLPALCIDFGTAVNLEYVDSDGCFLGGAIMPGRTLMRHTLNRFTAQLPVIELFDSETVFPAANTVDALRLGTDSVLVDAVKSAIEKAKQLAPSRKLRCAACGGDRKFFINSIPGLEDQGGAFTLNGIRIIWEANQL